MNRFPRIASLALLVLTATFFTAGCKSSQNAASNSQPAAADNSATGAQDSASDPASANLAPVSNAPAAAAPSSSDQPASAPAAPAPAAADTSSDQSSTPVTDASYGEQPQYTAPDPPPALPDYQQPPAPGDDYLWTPGYWGYASTGYYWVPGVWVQSPYQGALWTPGYWGWTGGHYGFFHGYWGPHIGFYGGLNYGFGYVGVGYQGGYWNSGHFYYNRSVNNINTTVVHNVYERKVIVDNNVRVSYNGGHGGLQVRPRPAELAALREPHAPPMKTQVQIQHAASIDRTNFVTVNHGRPANPVIAKAIVADRDVHPVAPPAMRNEPVRPENRPEARPEVRPNPAPPERKVEPGRPATEKPAPRVEPHPQPEARPKAEEHPAPPKPKPEVRPAPKKAPEEKPKPEDEHPR
jgi:hypothetical protein